VPEGWIGSRGTLRFGWASAVAAWARRVGDVRLIVCGAWVIFREGGLVLIANDIWMLTNAFGVGSESLCLPTLVMVVLGELSPV
jgi:hypothetical protein